MTTRKLGCCGTYSTYLIMPRYLLEAQNAHTNNKYLA